MKQPSHLDTEELLKNLALKMALLKSILVGHFLNFRFLPSQFLCKNKLLSIFEKAQIFNGLERITCFQLLPLTLSLSVHINPYRAPTVLPVLGSRMRNFKICKLLQWRKERTDMEGSNRTFREKPDEFLEVT